MTNLKRRKAFTLTELIVVIVIIGILAAILIPTITGYIKKANHSQDVSLVKNINTVVDIENISDTLHANAEDLRDLIKNKDLNINTTSKGYGIWFNKETNKVELKTIEEVAGYSKDDILNAGSIYDSFDLAPQHPEEVFEKYILISTEGTNYAEASYAIRNISENNLDEIKEKVNAVEYPIIRCALINLLNDSIFVSKNNSFSVKANLSNESTIDSIVISEVTSSKYNVVFNVDVTELNSENSKCLDLIKVLDLPKTITTVTVDALNNLHDEINLVYKNKEMKSMLQEVIDESGKVIYLIPKNNIPNSVNIGTAPSKADLRKVIFYSYDNSIVKEQIIKNGDYAVNPYAPIREGWTFLYWSNSPDGKEKADFKNFSNLTYNGVAYEVFAYYEKEVYTVKFFDFDNTLIGQTSVRYGEGVPQEKVEEMSNAINHVITHNGEEYKFLRFEPEYSTITNNVDLHAKYIKKSQYSRTVNFYATLTADQIKETLYDSKGNVLSGLRVGDGTLAYDAEGNIVNTLLKSENVLFGEDAYSPWNIQLESTPQYTYNFIGWSSSQLNIDLPSGFYDEDGKLIDSLVKLEVIDGKETIVIVDEEEADAKNEAYNIVACYKQEVNKYQVIINDWNGQFIYNGSLEYGNKITVDISGLNKEDYKCKYQFVGFADKDGNVWDLDEDIIVSDLTLYAKYEVVEEKKYEVILDFAGGEYNGETTVTLTTSNWQLEGLSTIIPIKAEDEVSSYTFKNWKYSDGRVYNGEEITENITLYANYESQIQEYRIVFMNGDVKLGEITINYGMPVQFDEIPTKDGYVFTSWDIDLANWDLLVLKSLNGVITVEAQFEQLIDKGVILYIDGSAKSFVSYNSLLNGQQIADIEALNPTKNDTLQQTFKFIGWGNKDTNEVLYTSKTLATYLESVTFTTEVPILEFYAKFEASDRYYTINFTNNGKVVSTYELKYDEAIPQGAETTKESTVKYDYTFAGYEGYTEGMTVTSDMSFEAIFNQTLRKYKVTYTIPFSGKEPVVLEVEYGKSAIYPSELGTPTKENPNYEYDGIEFVFAGWDIVSNENNSSIENVTGNMTLMAKFNEQKSEVTVNYYFGVNGEYSNSITVIKNHKVNLPNIPVIDGVEYQYVFKYWAYIDTKEEFSISTPITVDTNLIAVYEKVPVDYTVYYLLVTGDVDADSTSNISVLINILNQENLALANANLEEFFKTNYPGYSFTWKKDAFASFAALIDISSYADIENIPDTELNTIINSGACINTKDKGIYIFISDTVNTYKVTFDADNGTNDSIQNVLYGNSITEPVAPTKEGYTFEYWMLNGVEFDFANEKMPANGITLKAKWKINQYTISFESNGGTPIDSITDDYNSEVKKPDDPEKEGYTFLGWYDNENIVNVPSNIPAYDLVLTAKWELNVPSLTPSSDINKVYDGSSVKLEVSVNHSADVTTTYEWTKVGSNTVLSTSSELSLNGNVNDSGSYKVIVTVTDGVQTKVVDATIEVLITKADYDMSNINWDYSNTYIYSGSAQTVKINEGNLPNGVTVKEYLDNSKTDADKYTASVKFNYDTVNYNEPTVPNLDWEIVAKEIESVEYELSSNKYDGTDKTLTVTFVDVQGNKQQISYEIISEQNTIKDAGIYNIKPVNQDFSNYTIKDSAEFSFEINKADYSASTGATSISSNYTGNPYKLDLNNYSLSGVNENEKLEVSSVVYKNNNDVVIDKIINAGNYTAVLSYTNSDSNYNDVNTSVVVAIEILKVTPTISDLSVNGEYKTSDVITGITVTGISSVDGTFTLENSELLVGSESYKVKFTPSDSNNYNETTGYVVIKVLATITFNTLGGSPVETQYVEKGGKVTKPTDPTLTGYIFEGWDYNFESVVSSDLEITAQWKKGSFSITFKDGENQLYLISGEYGDQVTRPNDPSKEGYTFKGWDAEVPSTMPAEKLIINAIFEINNYTLTFVKNNGEEDSVNTVAYNTTIDFITVKKTGYTFVGWYTDEALKEVVDLQSMPANNVTLYAKWEANDYTITLDLNGGQISGETIFTGSGNTYTYTGKYDEVVNLPEVTKEGYNFGWWNLDTSTGLHSVKITGDLTLTAGFNAEGYYIIFNTKGGDPISSIVKNTDEVINSSEIVDAVRQGYKFDGWFTDEALEEEFNLTIMPPHNVTLYAKWIANEYTITFDSNGGSSVDSITGSYETNYTKPENPTKEGYEFAGWNPSLPDTIPYGNQTYTAKWDAINYSINVYTNGGTSSESYKSTYTIEDEFAFVNPTKLGYTFAGWTYVHNDTTTTINSLAVSKGTTGNITLTAIWSLNDPTINSVSDDVNVVYSPNNSYALSVSATHKLGNIITYKWYKDNVLLENTTNSYVVKNVADTGVYSVVITAKDSSSLEASITKVINVNIQKATIDMSNVVWSTNSFVYDGLEKEVVINNLPSVVTATYSNNKAIDSGNYEASAELSYDKDNYNEMTFELTKEWSISPKEVAINWSSESTSYTYNGQNQIDSISAYYVDINQDEVTLDLNITEFKNAGDYEFIVTQFESGNYKLTGEFNKTYSIRKATYTNTASVFAKTSQTAIYSNSVYTLPVSEYTLIGVNGETLAPTINYSETIKNAGNYKAYVTYSASDNYNPVTGTITVDITINKYVLSITKVNTQLIYNSENQVPEVAIVIPNELNDADYINGLEILFGNSQTNVGSYTTTVAINDPNYKLADNSTVDYSISAFGIDIEWSNIKVVFNENEQKPVATAIGIFAGDTVEFTVPGYINAGTYDVTATSTNSNYYVKDGNTCEFVIDKYTVISSNIEWLGTDLDVALLSDSIQLIYNGQNRNVLIGYMLNTLPKEISQILAIEITLNGNKVAEIINVGTYSVYLTLIDDDNYALDETPQNYYTVNPKIVEVVWELSQDGFTYNGKNQNANVKAYYVDVNDNKVYLTVNGLDNFVNANNYTANVSTSDSNYELENSSKEIIINKATPTLSGSLNVAHPTSGYFLTNQNTSEIIIQGEYLSNGQVVSGTISLQVTKLTVGTKNYTTVFTPDDKDNFATAGGSVQIITYATVSYVTNNNETIDNEYVKVDSILTNHTELTKEGHTFDGWFTDSECTNEFVFTTLVQDDITLYAKWTPITYTITFNGNGGTGTMANQTFTYDVSQSLTANTFIKTGYTFAGWSKTANGNVVYKDVETIKNIANTSENITLYAVWNINTYKVTLDDNNGNVTEKTFTYGAAIILDAPSRTGYTFGGWYKEANCTNANDHETMPAYNITLYAKWTINTYDVTLNLDGATYNESDFAGYTINGDIATITVNYGTTLNLPVVSKGALLFSGWILDGNLYSSVLVENNITLTATFSTDVTISFVSDGGILVSSMTGKVGESVVLPTPNRTGYTFKGWSDTEGSSELCGITVYPTSNITLYAVWEINSYTVTFANGDDKTEVSYEYGEKISEPTKPNKDGYDFDGWYYNNSKFDFENSLMPANNIEIIVVWTPVSYTITYNLDGGTLENTNKEAYTIETDTFTLVNPTKEGYTFAGWKDSSNNVSMKVTIEKGSTGSKSYTATWLIKTYTVNFYDADGTTLLDIQTINHGNKAQVPEYSWVSDFETARSYYWAIANQTSAVTDFTIYADTNYKVIRTEQIREFDIYVSYKDKDNVRNSTSVIYSAEKLTKAYGSTITLSRQFMIATNNLLYKSIADSFTKENWVEIKSNPNVDNVYYINDSIIAVVNLNGNEVSGNELYLVALCAQPVAVISSTVSLTWSDNNNYVDALMFFDISSAILYASKDDATSENIIVYGQAKKSAPTKNVYMPNETAKIIKSTVNIALSAGTTKSLNIQEYYLDLSGYSLGNNSDVSDFIIKSNDKLVLPYIRSDATGNGYLLDTDSNKGVIHSVMNIIEGVTLENYGTIVVGGEVGSTGTVRARAVVMNNGTINNYGTIYAYGYIKGEYGLINVYSTAKLHQVFKVHDWKGGNNAIGTKNAGLFPFNCWSIHNASCRVRVYPNATVIARAGIYMADTWVTDEVPVIASNGLFKIKNGYIDLFAEDTTTNTNMNTSYTSSNQNITQRDVVEVCGDMDDGAITITVKILITYSITTGPDLPCPVGFMRIRIKKGTTTLSANSYKFLPGSGVTIDEGATAIISSGIQVALYDQYEETYEYTDDSGTTVGFSTTPYQTQHSEWYTNKAGSDEFGSQFYINGTLIVNGSISGVAKSTGNGVIKTSSNSKTSTSIKELATLKYGKLGSSGTSTELTNYFVGKMSTDDNAQNEQFNINAEYTYNKFNNCWGSDCLLTIYTNTNNGVLNITVPGGSTGYNIYNYINNEFSKEGYQFGGYYLDETFNELLVNENVYNSNVEIYIKWDIISYDIEFMYLYSTDIESEDLDIVNDNIISYNINTNHKLLDPISSLGYSFVGWYTSIECLDSQNITTIDGKLFTNKLIIYGKWEKQQRLQYIINYQYSENVFNQNYINCVNQTIKVYDLNSVTLPYSSDYLISDTNSPVYFENWHLNEVNGDVISSLNETHFTGGTEITIYGNWNSKISINLYYNNELISDRSGYYINLTQIDLSSMTNKTGFETIWFTNAAMNSPVYYRSTSTYTGSHTSLWGEDYYIVNASNYNSINQKNNIYIDVDSFDINSYVDASSHTVIPSESGSSSISYNGAFSTKGINKLIICSTSGYTLESGVAVKVKDYVKEGTCGSTTYYKYHYVGMFNGNSLEQVIVKNITLGNYVFSNCGEGYTYLTSEGKKYKIDSSKKFAAFPYNDTSNAENPSINYNQALSGEEIVELSNNLIKYNKNNNSTYILAIFISALSMLLLFIKKFFDKNERKEIKMKRNLKKGFTLTELIVVIVIIGILAAVLIPTLTGYIDRAKQSNDTTTAKHFTQAIYLETEAYTKEEPTTASRVKELILNAGYSEEDFDAESSKSYFFYEVATHSVVVLSESDLELKAATGEYVINTEMSSPEAILSKEGKDVLLIGANSKNEVYKAVTALRSGDTSLVASLNDGALKQEFTDFISKALFVKNDSCTTSATNPVYVVFANNVTVLNSSNFNVKLDATATVVLPSSLTSVEESVVENLKDAEIKVETKEVINSLPDEIKELVGVAVNKTQQEKFHEDYILAIISSSNNNAEFSALATLNDKGFNKENLSYDIDVVVEDPSAGTFVQLEVLLNEIGKIYNKILEANKNITDNNQLTIIVDNLNKNGTNTIDEDVLQLIQLIAPEYSNANLSALINKAFTVNYGDINLPADLFASFIVNLYANREVTIPEEKTLGFVTTNTNTIILKAVIGNYTVQYNFSFIDGTVTE